MQHLKLLAVAGGMLAACLASGCTLLLLGGAGAAGYAYVKGEYEKSYPYPVAQTSPAVRAALDEMGLHVTNEASDQLGARLESRTAKGEKLTVVLTAEASAVTKVRVRVGVFGDEDASRLIFARMDQLLPQATAQVKLGVSASR